MDRLREFAIGLAVTALVVTIVGFSVREYGNSRYEEGLANAAEQVQHEREKAQLRVEAVSRQAQEHINDQARLYQELAADTDRRVAALTSDGDGLRARLAAALSSLPKPSGPQAIDPAYDLAQAEGQLLAACSSLAEERGADAERLADQVRGLQQYAQTVTTNFDGD